MKIPNCRLCRGPLSPPKLSFPATPLANQFLSHMDKQDTFPLQVCTCETCGHYQLDELIDPELLFRDYLFVAGTSPVNVEHFRRYAVEVVEKFDVKKNSKVLDIASNDGTLLKHFQDLGMEVLGIDPAKNISDEANAKGIKTIPEFFTEEYADTLLQEYGTFDIVTANNVFAHVPDMIGFTKGVRKILAPNGVYCFEVSYLGDVCDKVLFDTIYHEHSSYHTITPLALFFFRYGLRLKDVQRIDTHGGSIRVFVEHFRSYEYLSATHPIRQAHKRIEDLIEAEKDISERVELLKNKVNKLGEDLNTRLRQLKSEGKSIAIYGTPAKATTLMYALEIDTSLIDFAVDDSPLKQGRFTPGKQIKILHPDAIYEKHPDVLLVLAWNFADPIIKKHKNFKGTWIVPIPDFREIDAT
ncbi:MAG TPA: class I SAM-dependent methyltransferase [Anaerovoracaceae bacterium]|nr:class I SAM-dependent methyltransferase [Anaerovoracaceae bacterium]